MGVEPHFCVVTNPHCKLHRYTWSVSNSEIEWQRSVSNSEIEWQRKQVILAISRPVSPILLRPPPLQDVWPQCVYTLCVGLSNVFLDLLLWLTAQLIVQLTYDSSQLPNLFVCEHTHTLPSTYTPSVVLVCFPASFSTTLSSSHNLKITPFPCVWHMDRKDQTHTHTHTHTNTRGYGVAVVFGSAELAWECDSFLRSQYNYLSISSYCTDNSRILPGQHRFRRFDYNTFTSYIPFCEHKIMEFLLYDLRLNSKECST